MEPPIKIITMPFILEQGRGNVSPSSGVDIGVTWDYKTNQSSPLLLETIHYRNHVLYRIESILEHTA